MSKDRTIPILLAVLMTMSVILYRAGVARGQAIQLEPGAGSLQITDLSRLAYRGHLTASNGLPLVDGQYSFRFSLFESPEDSQAIWSEQHLDVPVQAGNFLVQLGESHPLPDQALSASQLYLQTAVRAPGELEFTTLQPPQVLQAVQASSPQAAAADMACPHDHVGETWTQTAYANGLKIKNTGGGNGLVVESNTSFWAAIEGNNSGSSVGVYGFSQSGAGVLGDSTSGYAGVFDSGNDQLDLQLRGNFGRLNANEYDESVLYLSSNANIYNKLDNDGGEDHYFQIANSGDAVVFYVDEFGNVWKNGTISSMVKTSQYGDRSLNTVESPEAWVEDFGQAALVNGEAWVPLDPIFAETVNLQANYHVFLTPICEQPIDLYVVSKSLTGFTVRGLSQAGEPSSCDFDYRIAAKRLGYESQRLEPVNPAALEAPR